MSVQDGKQYSAKRCRNNKINTEGHENSNRANGEQRPAIDDIDSWKAYWNAQGQPWRTKPEIDSERQRHQAERRIIKPNIDHGNYPFKNIKLSRADIEWLLATHENGLGPVDWSDKSQQDREGLDLRGADLRGVDLRYLPLARLRSGLTFDWKPSTFTVDRFRQAVVDLGGAFLGETHLEGSTLRDANLEEAFLDRAHLERADLRYARLRGAYLTGAHFEGANLYGAHLEETNLFMTHFEGANLRAAHFERALLDDIFLTDEKHISPLLADSEWGNNNLAMVNWSQIHMLGDEYVAQQKKLNGKVKDISTRLEEYEAAVRANRQVAVTLQTQGLNENAARFAYRAQLMQRKVFWHQHKFAKYLGSLFLDLLSGYGYKPLRCFIAYLLVIFTFAAAYFIIGHKVGPALSPLSSFVFSVTSFHGRGFFPGGIALDDPLTVVAAIEAFIGLIIEVTFIATLTQRLFGK